MGAELINADGQTDMMNLKIAFRNFSNTPKTRRHVNAHSAPHSTKLKFWIMEVMYVLYKY